MSPDLTGLIDLSGLCLAILLVRPRLWVILGIGIVAGLLAMFFSKSSIAWFNIPVHTVGAWVTALVALRLGKLLTGPVDWKPAVGALAYGAVSGGLFVTALLIAGILPLQAYVPEGWVPVLLSTLSSIIIDMILYPPAQWLYERIK